MSIKNKTLIKRWNYMDDKSSKEEWNDGFLDFLINGFKKAMREENKNKTVEELLCDIEEEFIKEELKFNENI